MLSPSRLSNPHLDGTFLPTHARNDSGIPRLPCIQPPPRIPLPSIQRCPSSRNSQQLNIPISSPLPGKSSKENNRCRRNEAKQSNAAFYTFAHEASTSYRSNFKCDHDYSRSKSRFPSSISKATLGASTNRRTNALSHEKKRHLKRRRVV